MKTLKNKTTATMIALFLIVIMAASTMMNSSKAQVATATYNTYGYINAAPNPCGVGQTVTVQFWLSNPPPNAEAQNGGRWTGMTVKVTSPDGTTQTLGTYTSDATGSAYITYTPSTVGNYTFDFIYAGQVLVGSVLPLFGGPPQPINYTYLGTTATTTLVAQQAPAPSVTYTPLPTSYWTRPINGQNYPWSCISSNWLMAAWDSETRQFDQGDALDPYAVAPASSHVLWTTPLTFGGIIGGEFGTTSFYNGMSYEQFFKPPIIIGGNLYYNTIHGSEGVSFLSEDTQPLGFNSVTCVSLTTGETLFTIPNATVSFGQIFNFISPNQGGAFAYLWDTSSIPGIWRMYDAWTGQYILSVAMPSYVSGGTVLLDNTFTPNPGNGDVMVYSLNGATLTLWNSTLMFENYEAQLQLIIPSFQNIWLWRPYNWAGQTLDGSLGVQWNVTLANFPAGGAIAQVGYDNTVYIYNTTVPAVATFGFPLVSSWCGYSMADGHQLWGPTTIDTTTKLPKDSTGFSGVGILQHQGIGSGGILPIFDRDTEQLYAWNVETGQFLWGPTNALTNPLGIYNWENEWIVDGILYNSGYDGMIHAYNATTGTHLWDYYSGNAGTITPYGTWPFYNGLTIVGPVGSVGNETMIATTGEHGNGVQPLYQGEGLYVLSAITGTPLWNIEGWFCQPVLADGVMVTQNLYDNQIYGFGQGPSKTTVSAPNVGVTTNTPVTISGTVTDISAGAQQQQVAADFPNGLPCVSDASMSQFMEAVYEQQPMPTNITGVPVTVYVLDSNNNYRAIGTTTTNAKGFYSLTWTPDITGNYTVTAVFAGSDSYYGSSANAAFYAGSPPATAAPAPTPASGLATQNALTYIGIAIIIVIIIIGAVIAILVTRKRP